MTPSIHLITTSGPVQFDGKIPNIFDNEIDIDQNEKDVYYKNECTMQEYEIMKASKSIYDNFFFLNNFPTSAIKVHRVIYNVTCSRNTLHVQHHSNPVIGTESLLNYFFYFRNCG